MLSRARQEIEQQTFRLHLLGPLTLLCPVWAVVVREEMEAVEADASHSGSLQWRQGGPPIQLAKPWPSAGAKPSHLLATQLTWKECQLQTVLPSHTPRARSMEAGYVISGALRVLKEKCRKFVYVDWSDVGLVSGGG